MIRYKNDKMKMIITVSLSLLLVICFIFEPPMSLIGKVFAQEKIVYLKDIMIFQGKSEEEARAAYERANYIFLPTDLNSGTEKDYVYMGYKTTDNKEEALYKISLLDMNGGFQIRDYKELYDEYQKSNYAAAETLQMATAEFIDSYNNGSPKALDAYSGMNLLFVPEAGEMGFGDYVIQGKTSTDFYSRVLTQASTGTVNAIISFLSAGLAPYAPSDDIDEEEDDEEEAQEALTWADQMSESSLWDIAGSDDLSQDERDTLYRQYGDDAKAIFKKMQEFATNFENGLATYNEQEIQDQAEDLSIEEAVENMDETDESDTGALYVEAYKMLNKYDANPDMPLGEWIVEIGNQTSEEVDLTQLYPMIDAMSYAQVKMTQLTGFVPCASNLGNNTHSEEYQTILEETRKKLLVIM